MEIVWYGQSCFRLRGKGCAVVMDPFSPELGYRLPRLSANLVTVSHDHPDHNYVQAVRPPYYAVTGPGEYEVAGTFVIGVCTDEASTPIGAEHGRNTAYLVEMEGLTVCHLGHIAQPPTQTQIEQFDGIDVLLIPVGGRTTLTAARAAEVVNLLEPSLVIPMYYKVPDLNTSLASVTRFLTEMAVERPEAADTLTITKAQLPEETRVALLTPKR